MGLLQFGLLAIVLYTSIYAQQLLGYSPIAAGVVALPMVLPITVAAQVGGRWFDRFGVRRPVLTGLVIATAGVFVRAAAIPTLDYWWGVPGMILMGLGIGLTISPTNTDSLNRATGAERGQASGLVQTVRQLGGTLGLAIVGAVILGLEGHPTGLSARQHAADSIAVGFLRPAPRWLWPWASAGAIWPGPVRPPKSRALRRGAPGRHRGVIREQVEMRGGSPLASGVRRLAFGVWRLAFGVWRLAFGTGRCHAPDWHPRGRPFRSVSARRPGSAGSRRGRTRVGWLIHAQAVLPPLHWHDPEGQFESAPVEVLGELGDDDQAVGEPLAVGPGFDLKGRAAPGLPPPANVVGRVGGVEKAR